MLAQNLGREILEEVLPYLNLYPDEEPTGAFADWGITGEDDMTNPTGETPSAEPPAEEPQ